MAGMPIYILPYGLDNTMGLGYMTLSKKCDCEASKRERKRVQGSQEEKKNIIGKIFHIRKEDHRLIPQHFSILA